MKILTTAVIALFTAATFIGCKKESISTPPSFTIEGKWEGTTGSGGYFGMNIKSGGGLERLSASGSVAATGNWELNGNSLSGSYHFPSSNTDVSFNATVNKAQNTFSGTWSNSGGEQGTMTASKK